MLRINVFMIPFFVPANSMPHNMSNKMTSSPIFLFKRTFPHALFGKEAALRKALAFVSSVLFSCVSSSSFIGTFMILCVSKMLLYFRNLLYLTIDLLCL